MPKTKIDYRIGIPFFLGLLVLILGTKGFLWAYPLGTLLIFVPLILSEVGSLRNSLKYFGGENEKLFKIFLWVS